LNSIKSEVSILKKEMDEFNKHFIKKVVKSVEKDVLKDIKQG